MRLEELINTYSLSLHPLLSRPSDKALHNPLSPREIRSTKDLMYFLGMGYDHFTIQNQLYIFSPTLDPAILTHLESFIDVEGIYKLLNNFYNLNQYSIQEEKLYYKENLLMEISNMHNTTKEDYEYFILSIWMYLLHKDLSYIFKHFLQSNSMTHILFELDKSKWT